MLQHSTEIRDPRILIAKDGMQIEL
jgi:hypothetical protein